MATRYERYRDLLRHGYVAAAQGEHDTAIAAFRSAAALVPGRVVPQVAIGRAELARGDRSAARTAFEAALAIDPHDVDARAGRAAASEPTAPRSTRERRREPAAVETDSLGRRWTDALDALDADAVGALAVELAGADLDEAAGAAFLDALEMAPAALHLHLAAARLRLRHGNVVAARVTLERLDRYLGVIDDPMAQDDRLLQAEADDDIATMLSVADVHRRRGRHRLAVDAVLAALRRAPGSVDVHLALARLRLDKGRVDEALHELDRLAVLVAVRDEQGEGQRVAAFRRDAATIDPGLRLLL